MKNDLKKEFDVDFCLTEDEMNKLLECDYISIGGKRFIKEDKVVDMLKKFGMKKFEEGINSKKL